MQKGDLVQIFKSHNLECQNVQIALNPEFLNKIGKIVDTGGRDIPLNSERTIHKTNTVRDWGLGINSLYLQFERYSKLLFFVEELRPVTDIPKEEWPVILNQNPLFAHELAEIWKNIDVQP
jgi:hypothetical protein